MQTQICHVKHPHLAQFVESILLFSKTDAQPFNYTTFPNTNLCLAIYANNGINYSKTKPYSLCLVGSGSTYYESRLYGFHDRPFHAQLTAPVDQICILFRPGALRAYTKVPYEELITTENVFDSIFSPGDRWVLEAVFNKQITSERVDILENFLLKKLLSPNSDAKIKYAIQLLCQQIDNNISIENIAKKCSMSASTLYRQFFKEIGQSPKAFQKTVRFRQALQHLLQVGKAPMTNIAHSSAYYDQSHFNKEIKVLSGLRPKQLQTAISCEQNNLIWLLGE